MIRFFKQGNSFLSNNYIGKPILFDGVYYKTVEHAYQASKMSSETEEGRQYREYIRKQKYPTYAIRAGILSNMRPDWSTYKLEIMRTLIRVKFLDKLLKYMLKETYPVDLQYGNYIHETFWGICHCPDCGHTGQNMLGILLMEHRDEITQEYK